ncbi:hypothetical protein [Halalkalicoccus salilacus]|uniref:hypothetical protein n=1 Tax=Halalkalicoccus salilacus TaxID=3117459 RepID=UPI00300EEAC1
MTKFLSYLGYTYRMRETTGTGRIGILCADDQPVFAAVAEHLRDAGATVQFFDPQSELSATHITDLSLLINKQVFPHVLPTLRDARQQGITLWNNLPATIAFSSRLIGLRALEEAGFLVPSVSFEKPAGEYVAKDNSIWDGDPELNGEGDFYQDLIPTRPIDYKYYAVDDGTQIRTAGKCVTSKLYGPKRFLRRTRERPRLTSRLRDLVNQADLRGVGVDFVKDEDNQFWAVDINLAAGYRHSELEPALYESITASLPNQ